MTDYDQIARRIVLDNAGSCKAAAEAIATALRAAHAAGVAAERERCAGIVQRQIEEDKRFHKLTITPLPAHVTFLCELTANEIAAAIRKGE